MDTCVPQALPGQPLIRQPSLRPSVEALHHRPKPLVDSLLPPGALHVVAAPHRQHVGRVLPALQPPPGDDVADLEGLKEVEHGPGLELAVPGQQLHLEALPEHPGQQLLHELLLVHVQRGLHVAERESLDVDEEKRLVAEDEALLAPTEPGVGVPQASAGVVGVPAAPRREVGAVYAGGLDEAYGGEWLAFPEPQRLPSEPSFDDPEPFGSDALLHLGEVGLAGCQLAVSAGLSEVGVSSQPLHQVLDVGYLLQLSEQQGSEVPFGVVLYWSPRAALVQPGPEDGMDRC